MTDRRIDWRVHLPGNYTKAEWAQAHEQVRRICGALATPDAVLVESVPCADGFDVWGHWADSGSSTVALPAVHPAREALARVETAVAELRTHLEEAS